MSITTTFAIENGGATITFQHWNGFIGGRQHVADVYHRLGSRGAGVQSLGWHAKPVTVRATALYATYDEAFQGYLYIVQSRAKFVNVLDGFGTTSRVLVHDASGAVVRGSHAWDGTIYPYSVRCELVVEFVGTEHTEQVQE